MRNRQEAYNDRDFDNAHWLHGYHRGENSDRGNYTLDTHFNRGYGDNADNQWGDPNSFNSNADQEQMSPQGRFQAGGAQYSGEDFTRQSHSNNPYGMTYTGDDAYNSGRHYDARADYSDRDYDAFRHNRTSDNRYGMADERFGHDVRRGNSGENRARNSRGDEESYRRYEQHNPNYDNDYSGGFAGRNYSEGQTHYGEGSYYSNLDRWNKGHADQRHDRYDQHNAGSNRNR
ncbi:hypothetical protein [Pontibacter liquoris]|uniref:hypothetical protein n=1 Tax=Pontibacter liquoris TaxID=2905677 RepID=UPI001FA7EC71|nr:hypothetical protein [Pontibacter liquoris]